ncbi:RNA pseudouridylate synthase family protein, partial [Vibrio parahaemolyticus V-223/04]
ANLPMVTAVKHWLTTFQ